MEQPSILAEEPEGLKMVSSWGLRHPEARRPFSLAQSLAFIIFACKFPNRTMISQPASALGFRLTLDP